IVYETDAKVEPNVKIIGAFPADSHPPIVYPVALTVNAKPEAAQYLAFLRSPAAKAVFETYGFAVLARPPSGGAWLRRNAGPRAAKGRDARPLPRRMGRDPPVAQDRAGSDAGGAAVRHRHRLAAGAQEFLGQGAARRPGAHAAGVAAGGHRLSAVDLVRPPRTDRRISRRSFRHRVLVPLDRRGALLRRHGISVAGAPDQARDRSDRPQARRCRRDARRRPPLDIPHRHFAAGDAGANRGHGAVLRQGAGRVRRDHHLRLQHSGRDPDDFGGDLHLHPDPRRRRGGGPAGPGPDPDPARGAGGGRMARAPRRHALPRGMSMLAVDVEKRLGDFSLAARFETAGGVTALFGASGAGKTTLVNMIAGLLAPDRGCIRLDDTV